VDGTRDVANSGKSWYNDGMKKSNALFSAGISVRAIASLVVLSAAFGLFATVPERQDPRTRTFLTPQRVVWTSGDNVYGNRSVVKNAESLLMPRHGQIPEERWKGVCGCTMENNGENASVILDFGRELHGGVQIGSMCPRGMKMRVRFGESVGEVMADIGTKSASNDHAIRDGVHDIPFMGVVEIGNTGFRFVRLDLVTAGKVNLECVRAISLMRQMPRLGEFCYPGYRHSFCHGWSAGPAAWCIAHILGLEALDAGGKTVRVRPFLGDLDWAEGALPTAQGVVRVRHTKRPDGSIDTKIEAPRAFR